MGLTFKENVPDLRNSRSLDLVDRSTDHGHPLALRVPSTDAQEERLIYTSPAIEPDGERFDLVLAAVAHAEYRALPDDRIAALVAPGGTLADLKGIWGGRMLDPEVDRWTL